ncbi:MAG TPA: sigma-70 family RNA polymerase sigma factor [Solirubrobacteraceae bacterium]|nr:sigma-70 family RNA polymerase sigma factor [Solirubrobacteraceae bacterium]
MFRPATRDNNLRSLADEDLMERVRGGEAGAFEVVFDRHGGAAYSLAYRMCGSRSRAEDVVQEAFLSLWRTGARYDRTRGSVRSWILSAVHNRAIDAFRRQSARESRDVGDEHLTEHLPGGERTDAEVEQRDDAHRVRSALSQLPGEQRRVIELAYFGGFSHSEIAKMLSLPAGTVKGRMRLGLSKLRITLGAEGFTA